MPGDEPSDEDEETVVAELATGTFEVDMRPGSPELDGAVGRFEMVKTFHGGLAGRGRGVMLSAGDPQAGAAGYVAVELVEGHLDDLAGSFVMAQLGLMSEGTTTLHYTVLPGSGTAGLSGITGTLELDVEADGTHRYRLSYTL